MPTRKTAQPCLGTELIKTYRFVWGDDPSSLLDGYDYQQELTRKLDASDANKLDRETLYAIVLWKLNRYPHVDQALLDDLAHVRKIKPRKHREVQPILRRLLRCQGVGLPMASTILRFLQRRTFQIVDDRVYRIVFPGREKYPAKPKKLNELYLENSERIYFEYLDQLHALACPKLPFADADRILYELDIALGNKIGGA